MPLHPDPLRVYLAHDGEMPDWETASCYIRCAPGCVAVERLKAPEKQGSLYIPSRAQHTYHDEEDDPVAGFEPSLGVVLSAGLGCWLQPGMVVIMRDGDGLEFAEFKAGGYTANQPVTLFGRVVPEGEDEQDPGYIEELPWEESLLAVVQDMDIRQMTGRNILLERDANELNRKTEGGVILPDVASENAASEAIVLMTGELVSDCKPGDRVLYHPMACLDFYDPDNKARRVVREMAILAVVE